MHQPHITIGGILLAAWVACPALGRAGAIATPSLAPHCDEVAHRAWLSKCLELNGSRNPPGWGWPLPAPGYFAQADLVREFGSDCASNADAPVAPSNTTSDACTWQEHIDWLEDCVRELSELVGKTRADLPNVLDTEGGLSTNTERDYQVRRCMPLKAEVTFKAASDSNDESPNDVVLKVVPYVGWFVAD